MKKIQIAESFNPFNGLSSDAYDRISHGGFNIGFTKAMDNIERILEETGNKEIITLIEDRLWKK